MNGQDNPLTEHDAAFMKACLDAINEHPHKGALEVTYNLSLMYFSALCRLAEQCADGRAAGLLMSIMTADEAKQDAVKHYVSECLEEEGNESTKH